MTHDPLTRYLLLLCDRLLWQENSGRRSIPKTVGPDTNTSNFSQKLGKRINKHKFHEHIHDFRSPVFAGHLCGMDAPGSEMLFIFQKVKPTWNQPDLSFVYMAACLLHLRNTSFASLLGDRRDLVGLIIRPDWLKTLTGCWAAWCREELQSNIAHVFWFVWKWKKNWKKLFKCPLVNEMLWAETETRPRRLAFSPRRDRDLPTLCRDRDETETFNRQEPPKRL